MAIQVPEECLAGMDQFPTNVDPVKRVFEVGIPASCILRPLNEKLDEFEAENEKSTDFQHIRVDVEAYMRDGGFLVKGDGTGQFREFLFTNPINGKNVYTPWVSIAAVGSATLDASVVDEQIQVRLASLDVSGNPNKWYAELGRYVFDYLFKDKLVTKMNDALAQINGQRLQELFFNLKGAEKAQAKLQEYGVTPEQINELLEHVQVNVRLAPDYLWLSIQW